MRFGKHVILFAFSDIPMVGNLNNGYTIGLTQEGAALCSHMLTENIDEARVEKVSPMLLEHLKKGKFSERFEEQQRQKPSSAYLHVTQRCNLNCIGCYSLDGKRNASNDLPLSAMKRILDNLAALGIQSLIISGGEPFLRDDIPEIVAHAKQYCEIKAVTILTNGTCLSAETLAQLSSSVDRISISFDGCSDSDEVFIRGTQRFSQLESSVRLVQSHGIPAHIIATIHAKNKDSLAEYVQLSKCLNTSLNFSLLSCSPNPLLEGLLPTDDDLKAMARNLLNLEPNQLSLMDDTPIGSKLTVRRNCGAGRTLISIAADGSVYPCHMLHREDMRMGNILEDNCESILAHPVAAHLASITAKDISECSNCSYSALCGGGCRARSAFAYETPNSKDPYCALMKEYYERTGQSLKRRLDSLTT